jgi:hypothetical protein
LERTGKDDERERQDDHSDSRRPRIHADDDGSVDVYLAPERPNGTRNFIQTIPIKGWSAILRLYGPLEPWVDKTWRLGEIVEVCRQ